MKTHTAPGFNPSGSDRRIRSRTLEETSAIAGKLPIPILIDMIAHAVDSYPYPQVKARRQVLNDTGC